MTKLSDTDNMHYLHEYDIDINNNEIYIMGTRDYITGNGVDETEQPGVEWYMANKFIKNLNTLSKKSDDPITIHMSTCGGHWFPGIQIYQAIKTCKNHITIINHTEARSMSSIIFLAGDELVMHEYSSFMFHSGTISTSGTVKQFRTEYKENEKSMEQMMKIYINRLSDKPYWKGKNKIQIRNWINKQMDRHEEVYLSAQEAVEIGFADRIIDHY